MVSNIAPHGGKLVDRIITGQEREALLAEAKGMKKKTLSEREISDLELIATGAFSPLEGFMQKADYDSVTNNMRLANGIAWSIPVNIAAGSEEAKDYREGEDIALLNNTGEILAIFHLKEKYPHTKKEEAIKVYKTDSEAHPGVAAIYGMGEVLLGGPISLLNRGKVLDFLENRKDPKETRQSFVNKGWKRIVGFQTRNPIHRAHEYIQKCALEIVDGILVHPLIGATKSDDIPAELRMKCYTALLENYYPADRVILSVFPANMRYAGPREAIFHALVRKNYGCTHFIVGRDHAGVGDYYGTFDAHHIFDEFEPAELGITPLFFDYTFYCKQCEEMASKKTCPHDKKDHISLSGTKVREMLRAGQKPPAEFSRPEVAEILINAMKHGA